MSKRTEGGPLFKDKELLRQSRLATFRKRMEEFVDEYGTSEDLKSHRQNLVTGNDSSEIVDEGRDERLGG